LKGRVNLHFYRHGIVAKAWPPKSGKRATPAQLQARADFKRMVDLVNGASASDRTGAMMIAQGSAYTWRDVLSRAVTGTLIQLDPGDTVGTMAKTMLDALGTTPGAVLVCTADGWIALDPPLTASVLGFDNSVGAVGWVAGGGGGGSGLFGAALGTIPDRAGTDLTTDVNLGTGSVVENANGIALLAATGSNEARAIATTTPLVPPFSRTALFQIAGSAQNGDTIAIGFWNGASIIEFFGLNYFNGWALLVGDYNLPSGYGGNIAAYGSQSGLIFFRLENTGSRIIYSVSGDGLEFQTIHDAAYGYGTLVAADYTQPCFMVACGGNPKIGHLLAWI
jgi:hypothetical protein